jgi:hypothetical protein
MIPSAAGTFERAETPCQNVAPALNAVDAAKRSWQVRATYDERAMAEDCDFQPRSKSIPIPMKYTGTDKEPDRMLSGIAAVRSSA